MGDANQPMGEDVDDSDKLAEIARSMALLESNSDTVARLLSAIHAEMEKQTKLLQEMSRQRR